MHVIEKMTLPINKKKKEKVNIYIKIQRADLGALYRRLGQVWPSGGLCAGRARACIGRSTLPPFLAAASVCCCVVYVA